MFKYYKEDKKQIRLKKFCQNAFEGGIAKLMTGMLDKLQNENELHSF